MHAMEQLASERIRSNLDLAEQLRHGRRQRTLRRAPHRVACELSLHYRPLVRGLGNYGFVVTASR